MNKTVEAVQVEQIDNAKMMQAGFTQCAFIALQALAFPELGVAGGVIAAQCALMPWLVPVARKAPSMAVAMSLTSAVISPAFSVLCLNAIDILKGFAGA